MADTATNIRQLARDLDAATKDMYREAWSRGYFNPAHPDRSYQQPVWDRMLEVKRIAEVLRGEVDAQAKGK